jgi:hypothetical protein
MQPAATFFQDDLVLIGTKVSGMVFAIGPDGPRAAHLPLVRTAGRAVRLRTVPFSQSKPADACARVATALKVQEWGAIACLRRRPVP